MKREQFKVSPQIKQEVCTAVTFLFAGALFLHTDYKKEGVHIFAVYEDGVEEHAFYRYEALSSTYIGQHYAALRVAGLEEVYERAMEYSL